jgi:hypothetical protein
MGARAARTVRRSKAVAVQLKREFNCLAKRFWVPPNLQTPVRLA